MQEADTPVTRDEINRLWADLKMLTMVVAHDVGERWGTDRVDAWYHSRAAAIESTNEAPDVTANAIRALDKLSTQLRAGARKTGSS